MIRYWNEPYVIYFFIPRGWSGIMHPALVLLTLLMLFTSSTVLAQASDTTEAVRQEFIERFKAETGFEGRVSLHPELLKIKGFSGNFVDIIVDENTKRMDMANKLEQVRDRVMPYLHANDVLLEWSRIHLTYESQTLEYNQVTNDYPLHKDFPIFMNYLLMFEYRSVRDTRFFPSSYFSVTDLTVPIPSDSVYIAFSVQEINRIIQDHYCQHDEKFSIVQEAELRYADILVEGKTQQMNLYYVAYTNALIVFVNPTTGEIVYDKSKFLPRRCGE